MAGIKTANKKETGSDPTGEEERGISQYSSQTSKQSAASTDGEREQMPATDHLPLSTFICLEDELRTTLLRQRDVSALKLRLRAGWERSSRLPSGSAGNSRTKTFFFPPLRLD